MPDLLFELGCEEIPAEDLFVLPGALRENASRLFEENRIEFHSIETYSTPRRLVLTAELARKQKDFREEKTGPPAKIARDSEGMFTHAAIGFAKNTGVPVEKLKTVVTPRGEYLAAIVVIKGKPTAEILKELLPQLVKTLPFKKYMRWGSSDYLFGRPIRNLVALFGGRVIPLSIAGIPAGRYTFGHRFLSRKKRLAVKSFADYKTTLAENGVVLAFEDRVAKIQQELHDRAIEAGGILRPDQDLLRTMANEVEYPEVLTGRFSEEFLSLPQEILINAMRKHQKYFTVHDENDALLPAFLTVLNTRADRPDLIRTGHERVLKARLRDAEFFWLEDRKTPLSARRPQLERLTYHEKLGSYAEKITRMLGIARGALAQIRRQELQSAMDDLIQDSKTDLVTLMVGEFPELQGVMGGLYSRQEGSPEYKWMALYDQYRPISAEDEVPRNFHGALLSVIDRLEVLCSGYILNMIPTGSRDPYALRRVATGLMKIVLEHRIDLDFRTLFQNTLPLYTIKTKLSPDDMVNGLMDLLIARFRYLMEQKGIAYDYLNAVLAVEQQSFLAAYNKANALWAKQTSNDLKVLARGFKRINNIIAAQPPHEFDEERAKEDGELRLYRAFSDLQFRVLQNIQVKDYSDALDLMVTLGPEIDNFFDEVLVMAEDPGVRQNRIALLQQISDLYRNIADFSALQIEL